MQFYVKIFSVLGFMILFHKANAQLDTMTYIKQFEANKAQYINQPLSKLLNDMTQIQPKTIWSMSGHKNMPTIKFSLIKFCEMDESFNDDTITLSIHWQTPLSTTETEYYEKKNDYFFTNEERLYYGSKIVKDIKVYR